MKKNLFSIVILCLSMVQTTFAQNVNLKFTGSTNEGNYIQLDSVRVENVSRSWMETLIYPDTVLTLTDKTGIDELESNSLKCISYPNPFNNKTSVFLMVLQNEKINLQVYNMAGQRIMEKNVQVEAGESHFEISLDRPQVYFLVANTAHGKFVQKLINIGSSGDKSITYIGSQEIGVVKTQKLLSTKIFHKGDILRMTGYVTHRGDVIISNEIQQPQLESEDITLYFALPIIELPTLTTTIVSSITDTSAISGGTITSDGGAQVTARGVCWSTSQNPTIMDNYTSDGSGMGNFTSNITGLVAGTIYYVRAYATNSEGTAYGNEVSFTTNAIVPSLTTITASNITSTTATSGGNVTSDGGATVTARGICWSTTSNPTINDSHTTNGSGIGSFTSNMTGLTAGMTYYVRAYATNSIGTSYGNQITFTTLAVTPIITTMAASNITSTTATSGGNITNDGGATVTARGICWSTTSNPTINDSHTTNGSGTGSFTSNMTILTAGTTYYVRAYATNSVGTSYGNQITFTTLAVAPIVTITAVSNITSTSAISGGNVTNDGGAIVTARGICWSTSSNPTISNSHTTNGSGTGSFTSNMTGLSAGTTYYVRAYATNSVGTAYSSQVSFTTQAVVPTLTTTVANNITDSSAVSGGNITNDGGASVTARGICWDTTSNPTINKSHTTNGSGMGSFTSNMTGLKASTTYYVRAYATNSAGTAYGNQITFTTNAKIYSPVFSVSATDSVIFSSGNLQWSATNGGNTNTTHVVAGNGTASGTWRFAPNQWDTIGTGNRNISSTYKGWIDLFGWGTSGYNNKYPYMTSANYVDYGNGNTNISGTNYDWGVYNAIYNPKTNTTDAPGTWRTLTKDEWVYLLNTRVTASGIRYAKGTVRGIVGLIIVPNNWSTSIYSLSSTNSPTATYTSNIINATNWTKLDSAGCVFLPAAGYRYGTSVSLVGSESYYWSVTNNSSQNAYHLGFGSGYLSPSYYGGRYDAKSVRLVKNVSQ
ncbi:MAG: T9SS type A sorting domain-containing protein [Bacteroidales bacterium]|nr:T9SS type A sorting domain-containing protein [Bacteroidales bacterium]